MPPRHHPDRIQITFDDHRLVANAGLILPATLAQHLGLGELVDSRLDLGNAPGRANTGDKMMTLVASALAGSDCIDDADVLRTGGTARTLGGTVKAPSTLGTFLRSFRWGHVRQLDRVSRQLLARAWQAGAGPRRCAFDHRPAFDHLRDLWTGQGGGATPRLYRRPWLSPAARDRRRHRRGPDGPAARGPRQHRPRRRPLPAGDGGAGALRRGQRTTHSAGRQRLLYPRRGRRLPPDGCPLLHHRPPRASLRDLIEAIPDEDWEAHPLLDGRCRRCGRDYLHPFQTKPDAAPVRLIVRRVKPMPGSQLTLFARYSYHGFITDRDGETLELEADHRRHAEVENAIRDLKYGVGAEPHAVRPFRRQRRLAGGTGDGA